ncbi:MAG: hypothetical protein HND57_15860 [Planctomycetes bacterium]|nr:hypothetical protein [Planctomycetota bacterium]
MIQIPSQSVRSMPRGNRSRVGRMFTLSSGLALCALALLPIPYETGPMSFGLVATASAQEQGVPVRRPATRNPRAQEQATGQEEEIEPLFGGNESGDNLFGEPTEGQEQDSSAGQDEGNVFGETGSDGTLFMPPDDPNTDPDELVTVALNDVPVERLVMQISEWTGKPVFKHQNIASKRITLVNPEQMPKSEALNLLCIALSMYDIGVIDVGTHIALMDIRDIQQVACPVFGPRADIMSRTDTGMIGEKIFQIVNGNAKAISDQLQQKLLPRDVNIAINEESNQIVIRWTIDVLQHAQEVIDELDVAAVPLVLETFPLQNARAEDIANAIVELFQDDESGQGGSGGGGLFGGREQLFRDMRRGRNDDSGGSQGIRTTERLKVTFDNRQNSVTVLAERAIVDQIREHIENRWDLAAPAAAQMIYDVQYHDAVIVKEIIDNTLAGGDQQLGTIGSQPQSRGNFRNLGRPTQQGSADETTGLHPLAGLVSVQADENKNRLILIARSKEQLEQLLALVKAIDQPASNTVPELVELVYADAWNLSDILNVILAREGASAPLNRPSTDLTEGGIGDDEGGASASSASSGGEAVDFPWQGGSASRDETRKISPMIGEVRVVPYAQRNALLVLAPPEHRTSVLELIDRLDQPGRQVMIQAIIAEISDEALTELGFRWGGSDVGSSSSTDNLISSNANVTGTKNNLLESLFDISTLEVGVNLTGILQLLRRDARSNILSTPKITTSDNEEAIFFDGQDVPFITDSQTNNLGQLVQSFDYKEVGIRLATRPHITKEGNVDLRVDLQLASVVQGQTLFGGLILDKRTTSTKITVRDGQTVVISGIVKDQMSEIIRKVPIIGDIPLIGHLFRSKSYTNEKTQIVAFIRPIVLENVDVLDNTNTSDHDVLRKLDYDPDMQSDYGQAASDEMQALPSADTNNADTGAGGPTSSATTEQDTANPDDKDGGWWWSSNSQRAHEEAAASKESSTKSGSVSEVTTR